MRLGSSTEYGEADGPMDEDTPLRPRGFFGATKAAGSLLTVAAADRRGIRSAVVRAFQVYGPHDHPGRLVPRALAAARDGTALPLTGPGRCRDWVYVDDVVEACVRVAGADHLPAGQVLNVGTGRQVANEELVAEVERVTGRRVTTEVGSHPGRSWDAASWVCDPTRARELLGWEAKVDLADGSGPLLGGGRRMTPDVRRRHRRLRQRGHAGRAGPPGGARPRRPRAHLAAADRGRRLARRQPGRGPGPGRRSTPASR